MQSATDRGITGSEIADTVHLEELLNRVEPLHSVGPIYRERSWSHSANSRSLVPISKLVAHQVSFCSSAGQLPKMQKIADLVLVIKEEVEKGVHLQEQRSVFPESL